MLTHLDLFSDVSIPTLQANNEPLKMLDVFSGIGGFALAARMVGGIQTAQFVEIDPYCQKVLAKNFPRVPIHGDITTFNSEPGRYELVTGGFPCQDISCANPNGRGLEGKRSGLFFELMRIVRQCRPRYVVLENVAALLSKHDGRDMGAVLWELSQSGFNAEWQIVSAASVGAPHLRERVFIVAYRDSQRRNNGGHSWTERPIYPNDYRTTTQTPTERGELLVKPRAMGKADANGHGRGHDRRRASKAGTNGTERGEAQVGALSSTQAERFSETLPHTHSTGREEFNIAAIPTEPGHDTRGITPDWNPWRTEPGILRVAHGISNRVDRIRGLGNAVVPQVAAIALQRVLTLAKSTP